MLEGKLYLEDVNVKNTTGTRPRDRIIELESIFPVDVIDDVILNFSVKRNLTIITSDIEFVIKNLLESRNVIYQNMLHVRYYLTVKKYARLPGVKTGRLQKLKNLIRNKDNSVYVTDSKKIHSVLKNIGRINANDALKYYKIGDYNLKNTKKIVSYSKRNDFTVITNSKHVCLRALFNQKKCIFVDEKFVLHYLEVDSFEFENVRVTKREPLRRDPAKPHDELQDSLRFIRNYIDVISKNLDFMECELRRRKEKEASLDGDSLHFPRQPQDQLGSCYN